MADGLGSRATGILDSIGKLFQPGRQPSGAATYAYVPPERMPASLPAPLIGVERRPMPPVNDPLVFRRQEQPADDVAQGARELVDLGIKKPSEAAARARRAMIPERESELPPEEQAKDRGALSVLGRFFGNSEAMANLAIAFNSMRMRPDPSLAAAMQKRIESAQTTRQANRTAEWLRSQGRTDLADLVSQNPAMASEALKEMMGSRAEQPSKVREYQYAKEQGYTGSYMDFLASQKAAGTSVNIDLGEKADAKFLETFAGEDAKKLAEVSSTGLSASRNLVRLNELSNLLEQAPQGATGAFKSFLGNLGIQTEGLDDIQAAESLISALVPEQRPEGSGAMSDADLDLFKKSLPRIINQPGGNRLIIETLRRINEYDQEGAMIVQELRKGEIDRGEAMELLYRRKDPLEQFRAFPKSKPKPPSDMPPIGQPPTVSDEELPENLRQYLIED